MTCLNDGGCPHCNPELAAITRDQGAGRFHALSAKLRALTRSALAVRFLGPSNGVPAPPDLFAPRPATPLAELLARGRSPIGPAPSYPPSTSTIAPPDLAAVIKEHRRA